MRYVFLKIAPFSSHFFFLFTPFCKSNVKPTKDTLLVDMFLKFGIPIRNYVTYVSIKFGDTQFESKGVMNDNIAEKCSKSLVIPTG